MLPVLRHPASAGARHRQGRTSSLRCGRSTLTAAALRRCHGSYGEPGTTKISHIQVSTLSGDPRGYADLAAGVPGGGLMAGWKVGIIRGFRGRRGAGPGACSARVLCLRGWSWRGLSP